MNSNPSRQGDELRARLDMIDIDVRCALGFGRATLAALAAMSQETRAAIDTALAEEAALVAIDDLRGSAAVAAILEETRVRLGETARLQEFRAQALERLLVAVADEGPGEAA
ncbi:hypothetical protein [Caulobacter sp. CCUG 60055]|uniref:hypothetical protein n=1 Tax=Caulobacter sp. CCUG 60055 TaxID=2100090 RepID=UPI001FA6B0DF|nr:hypothetical protein [Caulobacter sp. CCUG 60055]MBQ1543060.1 hypothetical protein [Caulobacteraceae bacterium]